MMCIWQLYFCKDCPSSDKTHVLLTWKNNIVKQFNGILILSSMTLDFITFKKTEIFERTPDIDNGLQKTWIWECALHEKTWDALSYSIQKLCSIGTSVHSVERPHSLWHQQVSVPSIKHVPMTSIHALKRIFFPIWL